MLDQTLFAILRRIVTASSRRRSASSIGCRTSCKARIRALQQRVAALTNELEDARRAREQRGSEAQRTARAPRVAACDAAGRSRRRRRRRAHPRAQPGRRGDPRRRLVGQSWQRVVQDCHCKSPSSADGDWSTRDGRRIALAASSLPQETIKIILLTDVTETRALQELAARNQRLSAIGKMAASLAHQIRTPLAGALLYLSQCRSRRDERERAKLLEKGIERLRHLDLLVQDMLVFARGCGPGERVRVADLFQRRARRRNGREAAERAPRDPRRRRARRARRQSHGARRPR